MFLVGSGSGPSFQCICSNSFLQEVSRDQSEPSGWYSFPFNQLVTGLRANGILLQNDKPEYLLAYTEQVKRVWFCRLRFLCFFIIFPFSCDQDSHLCSQLGVHLEKDGMHVQCKKQWDLMVFKYVCEEDFQKRKTVKRERRYCWTGRRETWERNRGSS